MVVHGDTFVLLSPEVATISSFLRLPMAGLLVLAELALFTIDLFIIGTDYYCIYLAAVPVALMLLIGYFCLRKHK